MKKLNGMLVLFLCISMFFTQCLKEDDVGNTVWTPQTVSLGLTNVYGIAVNQNGEALSGVNISNFATNNTTTNSQGMFYLPEAGLVQNRLQISAQKEGFFTKVQVLPSQGTPTLIKLELTEPINVAIEDLPIPTVVSMPNAVIELPPTNAYLNETTGMYADGNIRALCHHYQVTSPHFITDISGNDLISVAANGTEKRLFSYGAIAFYLADETNQSLQLAEGSIASIRLTPPSNLLADAPATLSLWQLNPLDAKWAIVGTAFLIDGRYVAHLPQVGDYQIGLDLPNNARVTGMVKDCNDNPVKNIAVNVGGLLVHTNEQGIYSSSIPSDTDLTATVAASYFGYNSNEINISPTAASQNISLEDLQIPCPTNITGTVAICLEADSNALVVIDWNEDLHITYAEAGNFSTILPASSINNEASIHAFHASL